MEALKRVLTRGENSAYRWALRTDSALDGGLRFNRWGCQPSRQPLQERTDNAYGAVVKSSVVIAYQGQDEGRHWIAADIGLAGFGARFARGSIVPVLAIQGLPVPASKSDCERRKGAQLCRKAQIARRPA